MKSVETFTLTAAEAQLRGLHPIDSRQANYVGVMSVNGNVIMYKWFAQYTSAAMWALEHSNWKYSL
jgi:hypothetical protein